MSVVDLFEDGGWQVAAVLVEAAVVSQSIHSAVAQFDGVDVCAMVLGVV